MQEEIPQLEIELEIDKNTGVVVTKEGDVKDDTAQRIIEALTNDKDQRAMGDIYDNLNKESVDMSDLFIKGKPIVDSINESNIPIPTLDFDDVFKSVSQDMNDIMKKIENGEIV